LFLLAVRRKFGALVEISTVLHLEIIFLCCGFEDKPESLEMDLFIVKAKAYNGLPRAYGKFLP